MEWYVREKGERVLFLLFKLLYTLLLTHTAAWHATAVVPVAQHAVVFLAALPFCFAISRLTHKRDGNLGKYFVNCGFGNAGLGL